MSDEDKKYALIRARKNAQKQLDREQWLHLFLKRVGVLLAAFIIVGLTSYVAIDTWIVNSRLNAFAESDTTPMAPFGTAYNSSQSKTETQNLPDGVSGQVQLRSVLDSYTVASDKPRAIFINSLRIAGRVLPVGLKDGAVDSPKNIYDAGWYTGSAIPGQNGAALIDGHAPESGKNYGLFAKLHNLKTGDIISIEMGDGSKIDYTVSYTETTPVDATDMKKVLKPADNSRQGLNIITCSGKWMPDRKTLDHRLVVYAIRT